jgi:Tfp pilus assembly protein PilN
MAVSHWVKNFSRADFLRSVGLYVMRDRLVFVRMRKNLLNVSLIEQEARELPLGENQQAISELTGWIAEDVREIALKAENDSRDRAIRQAIISLLPNFNVGRDPVFICVPQEQATVQQIFLPAAAADNLQQVLEYEIERQLPFRRDEVFYDYLPSSPKGDQIALYLFAIPRKNLAHLLDLLDSFGIKPNGVETTVTALANYLLFCKGEVLDPTAIIGSPDQSCEMIGLQSEADGWNPVHNLLYSHWFPPSDWAQGAGRELLYECINRTTKHYSWGDLGESVRSVNDKLVGYEDLVSIGNQRLQGGKQISHATVLPAVGAALRGVREAYFTANFLRHERADRGDKALTVINAALIALLIVGLVGWGTSYPIKDEMRLRQLQKENQRLSPSVEALRREETQMQKARKEASFLSDLDRRRGDVLRVLDELSRIVPTNAYLSNLRYRAGVLEIQGNAENASALIPLLERSPVFENVNFNAPSNRGRDNRETFSLKADLEKVKEGAAKPTKQP